MTTESNDGGLVDVFVKGAMFSLGALLVQLLTRRWTADPPVVVVEMPGPSPASPTGSTTEDDED